MQLDAFVTCYNLHRFQGDSRNADCLDSEESFSIQWKRHVLQLDFSQDVRNRI